MMRLLIPASFSLSQPLLDAFSPRPFSRRFPLSARFLIFFLQNPRGLLSCFNRQAFSLFFLSTSLSLLPSASLPKLHASYPAFLSYLSPVPLSQPHLLLPFQTLSPLLTKNSLRIFPVPAVIPSMFSPPDSLSPPSAAALSFLFIWSS